MSRAVKCHKGQQDSIDFFQQVGLGYYASKNYFAQLNSNGNGLILVESLCRFFHS